MNFTVLSPSKAHRRQREVGAEPRQGGWGQAGQGVLKSWVCYSTCVEESFMSFQLGSGII